MGSSDRERTVSESPLRPWKKEVAAAGDEHVGTSAIGVSKSKCTSISYFWLTGGTRILDESGSKEIGHVTSGCPSPSLKQNVAMGYVNAEHAVNDCRVKFDVRKKLVDASVAKMPFVPHRYYVKK